MLFATHYLEEADAYADRIVLVSRGRVVADGTPAEIRRCRPAAGSAPPGTASPPPRPSRCGRCPASRTSNCAATPCSSHAADSDAVARHLLTATPARDLQITSRGLEDAFIALTGDNPMTATTAPCPSAAVPPLGGFSLTFLRLEIRRLLRNRRTVVFTLIMPPLFFLAFGTGHTAEQRRPGQRHRLHHDQPRRLRRDDRDHRRRRLGRPSSGPWAGRASCGSRRSTRWPTCVVKVLTAMVLGALSVAIVFAVGALGGAQMDGWVWVVSALVAWVGALVFAAFGLFMGYLLPSENVMQILGPVLALLAFFGGLFVPLSVLGHDLPGHREVHARLRRRRARPGAADRRPGEHRARSPTSSSGRWSSPPARCGGSAATPPASERESHCSP